MSPRLFRRIGVSLAFSVEYDEIAAETVAPVSGPRRFRTRPVEGVMKRFIVAAILLAGVLALAQSATDASLAASSGPTNANVTEKLVPVNRSDVYCAGFISKEPVSKSTFVAGGLNSPYATRFDDREFIYIKGGSFQPGNRISVVREVRDPDEGEIYPGTHKLLKEAGAPYFDIGYAKVVEIRAQVAVAQIEFACQPILTGDLVVPFAERPTIVARDVSTMDRFPADNPALTGKIVLSQNFRQLQGVGDKVYINIGWEKGVKCGDYFRVTRGYSPKETDKADAAEFEDVPVDETQKDPPHMSRKHRGEELPRRVVGEIIILNVTPTTATGMITFGLEEIHVGDRVELEPAQAEAVPAKGTN